MLVLRDVVIGGSMVIGGSLMFDIDVSVFSIHTIDGHPLVSISTIDAQLFDI